jgi:hypothetical protein
MKLSPKTKTHCCCRDLRSLSLPTIKPRRRCRTTTAAAQKPAAAEPLPKNSPPKKKKTLRQKLRIFLRLWLYGYNDHDNLDHGYISTGYLDIHIKNYVYSNSRKNSSQQRLCHHLRPYSRCDCGGREEKRGETGNAPR